MRKFPLVRMFKVELGDLEQAFRTQNLPRYIEQTRAAIAFTVIAVSSLVTIDYLFFNSSRLFLIHLLARGLFVLYSVVIAYLLSKKPRFAAYELCTIVWGIGLVALTFFVDMYRPPDFTQNVVLYILMAFSGYVLIPLRPSLRAVTPILITIVSITDIFTIKEIPSPAWLGVTFSAYFLLHLAGLLTAVQTYNAHRVQFKSEVELRRANERLRELAITDDLTGIYNRRYFLERAGEEFERRRRHNHPLTLLIADLDLLKQINDTYGHHTGDIAIRKFTHLVGRVKRATDILGRLGGEEFGLLLPDTTLKEALSIVERIYDQRDQLIFQFEDHDIKFTFTAGMAECHPEYTILEELFRAADEALYRGKQGGRDRLELDR